MNNRSSAILQDIVNMIVKKNQDYGGSNVAFTGLHGVTVRMCDKAFRLHNLINVQDRAPNFESVVDSLRDLIAYCVIGHLLVDKLWNTGYLQELASVVTEQIVPMTTLDTTFDQTVVAVYHAVRDLYDWSEHSRRPEDIKIRFKSIISLCLAALLLHEDSLVIKE